MCFLIQPEEYTIGQNVICEGEVVKHVYLVDSGEFEVTKSLYFEKEATKLMKQQVDMSRCFYTKYYSDRDPILLETIFEGDEHAMIDYQIKTYSDFKSGVKGCQKYK